MSESVQENSVELKCPKTLVISQILGQILTSCQFFLFYFIRYVPSESILKGAAVTLDTQLCYTLCKDRETRAGRSCREEMRKDEIV